MPPIREEDKEPIPPEWLRLQEDLEKYQKEISLVQGKMDTLENQKQELFRIGVRLEGIITYIKARLKGYEQGLT